MWHIESPLEDVHNSWPVISRWAIKDVSESLTGQRAIQVHDTPTEEIGGSTTVTLYHLLASFAGTPKKSTYLKGLLVTPPSSGCVSVGDGCFFLFQPNQHSKRRSRYEQPAVFYKARRERGLQKCKPVPLFSLSLFSFGEIFIMSFFMK